MKECTQPSAAVERPPSWHLVQREENSVSAEGPCSLRHVSVWLIFARPLSVACDPLWSWQRKVDPKDLGVDPVRSPASQHSTAGSGQVEDVLFSRTEPVSGVLGRQAPRAPLPKHTGLWQNSTALHCTRASVLHPGRCPLESTPYITGAGEVLDPFHLACSVQTPPKEGMLNTDALKTMNEWMSRLFLSQVLIFHLHL